MFKKNIYNNKNNINLLFTITYIIVAQIKYLKFTFMNLTNLN